MTNNPWDPQRYERDGGFVWRYGHDLVELLDPRPGERVLDAGCGTGQLTARIAESGAEVVGVDNSLEMIDTAGRNYPRLRFETVDVRDMPYRAEFDAVFSNAVLHWVHAAGGGRRSHSAGPEARRALRGRARRQGKHRGHHRGGAVGAPWEAWP